MRPSHLFIPAALLATLQYSAALVIDQVGSASFWSSGAGSGISWTAFSGSDVANDFATDSGKFDFVGNSTSQGFYYAQTADYIFFRMRVNAGSIGSTPATSPSGTYALLIDIIDNPSPTSPAGAVAPKSTTFTGATGIDYAIVWDSSNPADAKHGLEMSIAENGGLLTSQWANSNLNDIDNNSTSKLTNDINGLVSVGATTYRSGDGYVRTTDSVSTSSFGTTTLIDFAVSWSYLENYTLLNRNQRWDVTLATDVGSQDHQFLTGDVLGAGSSSTKILSDATWSRTSWSAVPESGNVLAGLLLASGLLRRKRRQ